MSYKDIAKDLILGFDYSALGKEHEPNDDHKQACIYDLIWHIDAYFEKNPLPYLIYCAPENNFRYIFDRVLEPSMIFLDEVQIIIPWGLKTKKAVAQVIAKKVDAARIIFPGIGK